MKTLLAFAFALGAASAMAFPVAACTDFTGEWAGECKADGSDLLEDDAITITQTGCESIVRGNETFKFGVPTTYTENLEDHDERITIRADWNASKTSFTVIYEVVGTAKITGATLFTNKGTLQDSLSADQKLTSRHTTESSVAGGPTETTKTTCTYRKASH